MLVRYRNTIGLICIVLVVFISKSINAQNIENILHFADSLAMEGKYESAFNEYQRSYYFSTDVQKPSISYKMAETYLVIGNYDEARNCYDSAFYYSQTDSEKIDCDYRVIASYLMEENFRYALHKLEAMNTDQGSYFNDINNLFKGLSFIGLGQYDEAFHFVSQVSNKCDSTELQYLISNIDGLKYPSPIIASLLSVLIPGSGQVYAGRILDGANSLLLLTALTSACLYFPVLNVLIVPFLYRYYIGGIMHASQYAKERKKIKQYHLLNNVIELYSDTYSLNHIYYVKNNKMQYSIYLDESEKEISLLLSVLFLGYKKHFSSQDVDACVFHPSCSVYMMETTKKNGNVIGFIDGLDRLLRCHSFVSSNDYTQNKKTEKYYDAP